MENCELACSMGVLPRGVPHSHLCFVFITSNIMIYLVLTQPHQRPPISSLSTTHHHIKRSVTLLTMELRFFEKSGSSQNEDMNGGGLEKWKEMWMCCWTYIDKYARGSAFWEATKEKRVISKVVHFCVVSGRCSTE